MSDKIYIDSVGIDIVVTTNKDLVNIATLTMDFYKPDKTTVSKAYPADVTIVIEATGVVKYITESDFLDKAGLWKVQVFGTFTGSKEYFSETREFQIYPKFG
jgi:hypothetical protein